MTTAPGCGLTKGNRGWADDLIEMADPAEDAKLIAEADKVAAQADLTVLVLGQNEQLSREGWADNHRGDRMDLGLVGRQMELAHAVMAHKKPVVLVLIHGGPLAIPELAKSVPAILDGFYLGEETGTAVAEVLFGDVSPAGAPAGERAAPGRRHPRLLQLQAVGAAALPGRGAGPAVAVRVRALVHHVQVRQGWRSRRRASRPTARRPRR